MGKTFGRRFETRGRKFYRTFVIYLPNKNEISNVRQNVRPNVSPHILPHILLFNHKYWSLIFYFNYTIWSLFYTLQKVRNENEITSQSTITKMDSGDSSDDSFLNILWWFQKKQNMFQDVYVEAQLQTVFELSRQAL